MSVLVSCLFYTLIHVICVNATLLPLPPQVHYINVRFDGYLGVEGQDRLPIRGDLEYRVKDNLGADLHSKIMADENRQFFEERWHFFRSDIVIWTMKRDSKCLSALLSRDTKTHSYPQCTGWIKDPNTDGDWKQTCHVTWNNNDIELTSLVSLSDNRLHSVQTRVIYNDRESLLKINVINHSEQVPTDENFQAPVGCDAVSDISNLDVQDKELLLDILFLRIRNGDVSE